MLLTQLHGPENKILRIQAFSTLENIVPGSNFKSFFNNEIVRVTDAIINNETEELENTINLFIIILSEYTK